MGSLLFPVFALLWANAGAAPRPLNVLFLFADGFWLLLCVAALMAIAGIAAYRADIPDYLLFYGYGALWIGLYVSTSFATRPRAGRAAAESGGGRAPDKMRGGARPDSVESAR